MPCVPFEEPFPLSLQFSAVASKVPSAWPPVQPGAPLPSEPSSDHVLPDLQSDGRQQADILSAMPYSAVENSSLRMVATNAMKDAGHYHWLLSALLGDALPPLQLYLPFHQRLPVQASSPFRDPKQRWPTDPVLRLALPM